MKNNSSYILQLQFLIIINSGFLWNCCFWILAIIPCLPSFHVPHLVAPHLCRSLVMNHPGPIFNLLAHFNNCHFSTSKSRIMGLPQQQSLKIISQATKDINIESFVSALLSGTKWHIKQVQKDLEIGSSVHEQVAQIFSPSCCRKHFFFKRSQNEAELYFIKRFQCDFKHGA